jgi:uncharacterized protein (DUF2336 family)
MNVPASVSLDSLTDLGTRSGIDVRPTLLRVLTDLYVQKPTHTPEEDRQYTELALRLMEAVDVATRATVAARLATHPFAPAEVVARLHHSLPEEWRPSERPSEIVATRTTARSDDTAPPPADAPTIGPEQRPQTAAVANELNELFLGANAEERRLILLNLEVVGLPTEPLHISRDPHACERLEAAALTHNGREFVQHLARSLHIAPGQALRIVRDESGEPIVIAAKTLHMPPDMLQRILLFLNPSVGHSVERVHALATLYDDITLQAAEHMLALWQSLRPSERTQGVHQPLHWNDQAASRPRATAVQSRSVTAARPIPERRSAS